MKPKELLTLPEAAEILKCSRRTVRRLVTDRKLQALKVRGALRVTSQSLDEYILQEIEIFQFENGEAEYSGTNVDKR